MHRMRWLLVVALGCGSHPPAPTEPAPHPHAVVDAAVPDAGPLDQDLDRLATRSLGLLDELGRAFATVGEDCTAATAKLGELSTRYADVIAANAKLLQEGREMQLKLALRRYEERFLAAAKLVMESKTVAACALDDPFTRAFGRLAGP
jgi:hypothetical protein